MEHNSKTEITTDNGKLSRYLWTFGIVYSLGIVLTMAALFVLDIEGNSGVAVVILIAAAYYTAMKFVNDRKRVFTPQEKSKMVWLSLLLSVVISLVVTLGSFYVLAGEEGMQYLYEVGATLPPLAWLAIVGFVLLLQYAVLYFSYGSMAKKYYKKIAES